MSREPLALSRSFFPEIIGFSPVGNHFDPLSLTSQEQKDCLLVEKPSHNDGCTSEHTAYIPTITEVSFFLKLCRNACLRLGYRPKGRYTLHVLGEVSRALGTALHLGVTSPGM